MKRIFINDSKENYPKRIKASLLLAIILFIVLFALNPEMRSKPYVLRSESRVIVLEPVIEPLKNVSDIKEIPRQSLPKRIVETKDPAKVSEIEFKTSFEESLVTSKTDVDNRIYTIYETAPVQLNKLEIKYPELARKIGIEGKVFLSIVIEKNGRVSLVEVLKSDHQIFDEAAMEAAKKLLFSPAMSRDLPVRCVVTLPIIFRLTK